MVAAKLESPPHETDDPPRLFGTDGIRMVVGRELTPSFVTEVAAAVGTYLEGSGEVLIARDFRTSSEAMARILGGTLLLEGVDVCELGSMPTPCLQYNIRALGAQMGLTVTASHNPTEFNGIKVTGPEGMEIPRDVEQIVERAIAHRAFLPSSWERVGRLRADGRGIDRYLDSIESRIDAAATRAAGLPVVLDPGNGTSAVTSPRLLREIGTRLITLNSNPDGHFPGRPSEPTEENLWALSRAVQAFSASLGVAHDGDSDRVAFVDEQGTYVPGDVTLALFAQMQLREHPGGTVVTSVTSSTLVDDVVRAEGGRLEITRSGSLPVARRICDTHAIFGGEENGGYYWPTHQIARDGPMSSAKMVELLTRTGRPLSELVAELPRYHVAKTKVPLPAAFKAAVVERVRDDLEREADRLVTLDGVKAFYPDGWLLVRPSGTEPLCRIYGEARTREPAQARMQHGVELVERHLAALRPPEPATTVRTPARRGR